MKVLLVGPLPPPVHGVSVMQKVLVESDLRNRFDLHSLDLADRTGNAQQTMGRLTLRNVSSAIASSLRLFWKMLSRRPKVVFLFISQSRWGFLRDAVLIRICRLFGARVVANLGGAHFRVFYESCPPRRQKRIRKTLGRISLMQVLGSGLQGIFEGLMPADRIVVTPNGIPLKEFAAVAEGREHSKGGRNILFMGTLCASKGVADLIEAFGILAGAQSDTRLLFAGSLLEDEGKQDVLAALERCPYRDRIEMLGVVRGQEKLDAFARADVFALPTWYPPEGQPVAILEAMACGLPVVSCDRGAITDMVVDGEGGFIVAPREPKELATTLGRILDDADLQRKQGEYNIQRVRELYSLEKYIDKVEEDIRFAAAW